MLIQRAKRLLSDSPKKGHQKKISEKRKKENENQTEVICKTANRRQKNCRRELGGFGGVDTFRVATKVAGPLFFVWFVCLFVSVLLREEAWRRRRTTTTTTTRRAFEVASLQRKEFQQIFFVSPLILFLFSGVLLSRNNKTALASRFGVANKAWQEEK
jgi:hypothetical protein